MFGYGCVQKLNKIIPKNSYDTIHMISPAKETAETQPDISKSHANMLVSIQKQQRINNGV